MNNLSVAVVGATGAVGREMLRLLEDRSFSVSSLYPLASSRSAGAVASWSGQRLAVSDLATFDFEGIDLALFSAGGSVSIEHVPRAVASGAVVIDNTSAFRMDPDVPLVVPEVNMSEAKNRPKGIIANPNCSTIQVVVPLEALRRAVGIKKLIVSTYQSASGAGSRALDELSRQAQASLEGREFKPQSFPRLLAFNLIPQIGSFEEDGFTSEEHKMINETRKIMNLPGLRVSATCVRVPVRIGHCAAVHVELNKSLSPEDAREILSAAPGVSVMDDISGNEYPDPLCAAGTDPCWVGRIRKDPALDNGLVFWVAADNLRKGAALNAVQIAEGIFTGN